MIEKSQSIKNIAKALFIFDAEMEKICKTATNPFFKNAYAPLPEILSEIKEPLQKAGLTVKQFPTGEHELTTLIMHYESGEFIQSAYVMKPAKDDPQGEGSRITYQRRYALGAALGLNIDEDDDGNKASQNTIKPLVKPQKMTETEYGKIELDIKMSTTAEELNQVIEDLNKKWVNDPAKVITVDQKKGLRELIEQRKNELK
jgi:hypothetical protein